MTTDKIKSDNAHRSVKETR